MAGLEALEQVLGLVREELETRSSEALERVLVQRAAAKRVTLEREGQMSLSFPTTGTTEPRSPRTCVLASPPSTRT